MFINNSSFKAVPFVYRTPLYKATVLAAVQSKTFRSRRAYAVALSIVSKTQFVDWYCNNLVAAFSWDNTIYRSSVWKNIDDCYCSQKEGTSVAISSCKNLALFP